jgi:DNA-binding transcriptional LysR family regulator
LLEKDNVKVTAHKFSSIDSMRVCLRRGLGFTLCPEILVEKELYHKHLVRLDWRDPELEAAVVMIWHKEKWCSPLLKDFMMISEKIMSQQR